MQSFRQLSTSGRQSSVFEFFPLYVYTKRYLEYVPALSICGLASSSQILMIIHAVQCDELVLKALLLLSLAAVLHLCKLHGRKWNHPFRRTQSSPSCLDTPDGVVSLIPD